MARYIDAEALIEQMEADAEHIDNYIVKMALYSSIDDVKNAPTADVVEVVRCKDCADWQTDWVPSCGDNGSHYCATMDRITKPNDYCSCGERWEE